jgi:hypothetical protein
VVIELRRNESKQTGSLAISSTPPKKQPQQRKMRFAKNTKPLQKRTKPPLTKKFSPQKTPRSPDLYKKMPKTAKKTLSYR